MKPTHISQPGDNSRKPPIFYISFELDITYYNYIVGTKMIFNMSTKISPKYFIFPIVIIFVFLIISSTVDWDYLAVNPGTKYLAILMVVLFFGLMIGIIYFGLGYSWFEADPGQIGQTVVTGTRYTFTGDTKAPFFKYRWHYLITYLVSILIAFILYRNNS